MQFITFVLSLAAVLPSIAVPASPCTDHEGAQETSTAVLSHAETLEQTAVTQTGTPSASPDIDRVAAQGTGQCHVEGSAQAVPISLSKPANAVQVPGNFIGFGFETAFLNDYTVGTFSENLVNSVASRLGEPLTIRVGGTSGDRLLLDGKQQDLKVCIDGDCPVGSSATYILGPSYFRGFRRFRNQKWTIQARLGAEANTTASLRYVRRAYRAAGADRVDAIAIGNEPDTYDGYTIADYVQDAVALQGQIVKRLDLSDDPIFEILDTADGAPEFGAQQAFENGINHDGRTKYVAQHWYQSPTNLPTYGPEELQRYLMNHSAITAKYQEGYLSSLQYVLDNEPSVGYVISESGSSLVGPPKDYQDAFGAALWDVDFNLYSMSIGVKRLDGTHRPAAPHSYWVPDKSANSPSLGAEQNIGPQVRGPYYALPMLADFIGKSSGAVVEILGEHTLTAYALYDETSGALRRVAIVNLQYWSADIGGERGSQTLTLPVGKNVESVNVKRLRAEGGAHASGFDVGGTENIITWAGETWSYKLDKGSGSRVAGVLKQEKVTVCNGVASITVPDSEAVVVFL